MKIKKMLLLAGLTFALVFSGCGSSETVSDYAQAVTASDKDEDKASDEDKDPDEDNDSDEDKDSEDDKDSKDKDKDGSGKDRDDDGEAKLQFINTYFDDSKYDDESNIGLYFQCFGNHILLPFESEKAYPRLAASLRELADQEEKFFRDEVREFKDDALEFAKEMNENGASAYYSHYAEDVLKRADDKCVSVLRVVNGFLGGAHPDYYYETYNYDPKTGERIRLSDVIKDQEKLNEILEKKLVEDYPDVEYFGLSESLAGYDMSALETGDDDDEEVVYAYAFTLDPDGVSFYFSPYGISAYAYGDQIVKILYSEEPSLFKEDYAVEGPYISYMTDRDNKYGIDGKVESIGVIRDDYEENGMFKTLRAYKGDSEAKIDDLYYYSMSPFIAKTDDDKYFMYVIANMESDYKEFIIFDMNGKEPVRNELKDKANYTYMDYFDDDNGVYGTMVSTDPENMLLAERCDLLSTYNACGRYEMDDKGLPELKGDYLEVPGEYVLTSIADLTSDIVDEEGEVKEKDVVIPKGEEYRLYRTDGEKIVDAKLSDGRIVRMEVSPDYPHKVNNTISEDALFKELYYAG